MVKHHSTEMRFDKIIPSAQLQPYVSHFVISEQTEALTYPVFPSTGLVIGFQYRGSLTAVLGQRENKLTTAGITGLYDQVKTFRNSTNTGTILVIFSATGISHFSHSPAHDLFNQSVSLTELFEKDAIAEAEDKLSQDKTDSERIRIIEHFLLSQLKKIESDKLIIEAVRRIYQSHGTIRIKELHQELAISQSPFEKRFRKTVGTSPKKFASIVRFNAVLKDIGTMKSLTQLCYEYGFFDQAHFTKDFKQYTGDTPENFKRFL